ncbi:MAG: SDR family NAD(P)-dependent oxidoreductase [Anaerolineae bacterium]
MLEARNLLMTKTVLITGASRGIGLTTACLLVEQGYKVWGTSRHPDLNPVSGFDLLPLDVRNDDSVKTCVETVLERAGHIDVLINNAGVSLGGAVEEASLDEAHQLFETNFFGVIRMTNAVLPHMRRAGRGYILNIGSLAGLVGVPYIGLYAAAKHALAGYTASLRYELKSLGIQVVLIEPGDARTAITNFPTATQIADYDGARERAQSTHEFNVNNGLQIEPIAYTILKVIESTHPRLRYSVTAGEQFWVPWMRRLLPEWLIERIIRNAFKLDG